MHEPLTFQQAKRTARVRTQELKSCERSPENTETAARARAEEAARIEALRVVAAAAEGTCAATCTEAVTHVAVQTSNAGHSLKELVEEMLESTAPQSGHYEG